MNILRAINRDFPCPDCHQTGGWTRLGKPSVRLNSSIHRLKCQHCGAQVVAKVQRGGSSSCSEHAPLREEYEALRELESAFPQDMQYGTLEPLGYLHCEGAATMITRFFRGVDLAKHMQGQDPAGLQATCLHAGAWLRKLHQSGKKPDSTGVAGSADKIAYLSSAYGAILQRDTKTRVLFNQLEKWAAHVDGQAVHMARNHGDFKPANMLCNGTRYVGLDVQLQNIGPVVYDLAPFLNHLWLAGQAMGAHRLKRCYRSCEAAFLQGYGEFNEHEMLVLRWAQLYFVLCYLGAHSKRGWLAATYAKWKVRPLGQNLVRQLKKPL